MSKKVALCADEEALREPALIGLDGENLEVQSWLATYASAEEARARIKDQSGLEEVWVSTVHDIEPINLAAALKQDRPDACVCLCFERESGSFKSRANIANIDALLDKASFVRRYTTAKQTALSEQGDSVGVGDKENSALACAGLLESDASRAEACDEPSTAAAPGCVSATASTSSASLNSAEAAVSKEACAAKTASATQASPISAPSSQVDALASSCFFMPVVSGSGGSGKSTIAALAALFAQQSGYRTVVVDLDLQFGDMKQVLASDEAPTFDQIVENPALIETLVARDSNPALVAAAQRVELAEQLVEHVPAVLTALSKHFDVVIANTGSTWSEQHALVLERASKVLFLIDQSASSLRASKHAVELCARCGIATSPFVFAVNRYSKSAHLTPMDASCALMGARTIQFSDGGRDIEDFVGAGCILDLLDSDNALVEDVKEAMRDVLPNFADKGALNEARRKTRRAVRRSSRARLRRRRETA